MGAPGAGTPDGAAAGDARWTSGQASGEPLLVLEVVIEPLLEGRPRDGVKVCVVPLYAHGEHPLGAGRGEPEIGELEAREVLGPRHGLAERNLRALPRGDRGDGVAVSLVVIDPIPDRDGKAVRQLELRWRLHLPLDHLEPDAFLQGRLHSCVDEVSLLPVSEGNVPEGQLAARSDGKRDRALLLRVLEEWLQEDAAR